MLSREFRAGRSSGSCGDWGSYAIEVGVEGRRRRLYSALTTLWASGSTLQGVSRMAPQKSTCVLCGLVDLLAAIL